MRFTNSPSEVKHIVKIMEQCADVAFNGGVGVIIDKNGVNYEALIVGATMQNNLPRSSDVGAAVKFKNVHGIGKELDALDIDFISLVKEQHVRQKYIDAGLIEVAEPGAKK